MPVSRFSSASNCESRSATVRATGNAANVAGILRAPAGTALAAPVTLFGPFAQVVAGARHATGWPLALDHLGGSAI